MMSLLRFALVANNVMELRTKDELKIMVDKVKDFFGDAKESFGKISFFNTGQEESQKFSKERSKLGAAQNCYATRREVTSSLMLPFWNRLIIKCTPSTRHNNHRISRCSY